MNTKELKDLYLRFNDEYFSGKMPEDLPVTWNTRLRTTAGYCRFKWLGKPGGLLDVKSIDLNPRLLDTEDKIIDTLIHEMVHGWLTHVTNKDHGHNWQFKAKMDQILGWKPCHNYHSYDVSGLAEKRRIACHCPNCGIIGHRARMPRQSNLSRYRCNDCDSAVTFVDNRKPKNKSLGLASGFNPFEV